MEIIEIIGAMLEFLLEGLADDVARKMVGFIGWIVASILTWGRCDWECDDWQAIVTGAVSLVITGVLVIKYCLLAPHDAESLSCVCAPGLSLA